MAKNKNEESGIIMKIQKQTGCLLFVIGAAMLAFVLTDFFKSGTSMFGGSDNVVGEIAGDEIDYNELQAEMDELREVYGGAGAQIEDSWLAEQAWNKMIQERVIEVEHDKLGIQTSSAEINDALLVNPDPIVKRNFTDTATNQFDEARLRQFVEIDMQDDPEKYRSYMNFIEKPLRDSRDGLKYEAMVKAGIYTTTVDAKYEHDKEEFRAGAKAVGLPYSTIPDSSIAFDDSDLKKYLAEHKSMYQQLASRDIRYVSLNVFPSAADTAEVKKNLSREKEKFANPRNDSSFVMNRYTLQPYSAEYYRRGATKLSPNIEDKLFALDSGQMTDVIYSQGTFGLYKVTGVKEDTVASMRARHVFFAPGANSEDEAKQKLAEIQSGTITFEAAAKDNYDGSGENGGDLGWFTKEGGMNSRVPDEIREKAFASSVGSYFIVKTSRGHHIVNITDGPSKRMIQFVALVKPIEPGLEADKKVEQQAGRIYYETEESEDFESVLTKYGKSANEANKIMLDKPSIPGINDPKQIVRWLYDDKRDEGDVSTPFKLTEPDRYVVVQCVAIREKGTATLENNREQITSDYVRDQKGEKLVSQIKDALASANDPDALATAINSTVQVVPAVNLNSGQATGVGAEPRVIGAILGLDKDQRSEPIKGASGVYVVWGMGQMEVGAASEFNAVEAKRMVTDRINQTVDNAVKDALRTKADITDKRFKFF